MTRSPTDGPDLAFLGPSLSWAEAERLAPGVVLLPPASLGDVISAVVRYQPHAIALIDGNFLQTMAVFHKELIDAMARGVWVIGASSMGALRAAECADFGMIPVGSIAHDFLTGRHTDDDEVALVHADEDSGFRPLSTAMVEVRATLAAAVVAGVLDDDEAATLVAMQKQRWFPERALAGVVTDAQEALGVGGERLAALRNFVRLGRVDVKGDDARLALQVLGELPMGPVPVADRPDLVESGVYRVLRARDQILDAGQVPGERTVRREDVRTHLALTDRRYPHLWSEARRRVALIRLSNYLAIELTTGDLEAAAVHVAEQLGTTVELLVAAGRELDMDDDELNRLIAGEARVRRLEEWAMSALRADEVEQSFHDVLRLRGLYVEARSKAAAVEHMASNSEERDLEMPFGVALGHHAALSGLDFSRYASDIDRYIIANGLESRPKLYDRVMTHVVARRELLGIPAGQGISAADTLPDADHSARPVNVRGLG
jgi:hypothetical protein